MYLAHDDVTYCPANTLAREDSIRHRIFYGLGGCTTLRSPLLGRKALVKSATRYRCRPSTCVLLLDIRWHLYNEEWGEFRLSGDFRLSGNFDGPPVL